MQLIANGDAGVARDIQAGAIGWQLIGIEHISWCIPHNRHRQFGPGLANVKARRGQRPAHHALFVNQLIRKLQRPAFDGHKVPAFHIKFDRLLGVFLVIADVVGRKLWKVHSLIRFCAVPFQVDHLAGSHGFIPGHFNGGGGQCWVQAAP
ncbi:hypothetical protein D3C79_478830 [compost metagenome]